MHWKIGLIGFGNVGKAFIKLYSQYSAVWKEKYNLDASFHFILNSKGAVCNKKGLDIHSIIEATSLSNLSNWEEGAKFNDVFNPDLINLLIEVSPTNIKNGEPALSYIKNALENKISVVTGNKGPLLFRYKELISLAQKNNLLLGIGCAAGAAFPSINFGLFDLAGCEIFKIEGILNGVCNYILTKMYESNISFDEALQQTIAMGIAETDPSYDIDGLDTAVKIIIITNALMNSQITLNDINIQGIRNIDNDIINNAKKDGNKIKLIGYAIKNKNKIDAGVRLIQINRSHPFWNIDGTKKAVLYSTELAGDFLITGGASSPEGAAFSLWRDIINYKPLILKLCNE
jgi:homoserine dehydrogenase